MSWPIVNCEQKYLVFFQMIKFKKSIVIYLLFIVCLMVCDNNHSKAELKISSSKGKVIKTDENTLVVYLENGDLLTFENYKKNTDDASQYSYTYMGFDHILNSYMIKFERWEEYDILSINYSSGKKYTFQEMPVYNPSRKNFLYISGSEMDSTSIHVYRVLDSEFMHEYHYEPKMNWFATYASWKTDSKIEITEYTYKKDKKGSYVQAYRDVLLYYSGKEWLLDEGKRK